MKPQLIIAGAGRDGTVSMHHFIAELYAKENQGKQAAHEFASRECYNYLDAYWRNKDNQALTKLRHLFTTCPYDAIIGNGYGFAFTEIPDVFSKETRFIHLKRHDREAAVASLTKCATFFPEANGHYSAEENQAVFQVWRTSAFHLGEVSEATWHQWSLNEKFAWYYDRTHDVLDKMAPHFSRHLSVYTEDLSDPNKLAEIADFLEITVKAVPVPVRKNSFVYADVSQIDSFFVPKTQWLYSGFNFPRSVEDELSAIQYFCERFISWNSYLLSEEEKGEFSRYLLPKQTMLDNVKRGRKLLKEWQRTFRQLEKTVKRRSSRCKTFLTSNVQECREKIKD